MNVSDHVKQADQSWGAPTGESEWKDEQAGEAIAHADEAAESGEWGGEEKKTDGATGADDAGAAAAGGWDGAEEAGAAGGAGEGGGAGGWDSSAAGGADEWDNSGAAGAPGEWDSANAGADGGSKPEGGHAAPDARAGQPAAEPEPEDNSKSYADYLAEQAEKKLRLNDNVKEARKPNEGSKQDKKWAAAKAITKDEDVDEYMAGKGGKEKRERQRKEKTRLEVDLRYVEPSGGRGGGDRGRGGRGRGGRGRGDGYRGRGDGENRGGGYRGNRGGRDSGRDANSVNVTDENAFPSLSGS